MELVSTSKARSVWLFAFLALNPHGIKLDPELIIWLREKYSFSKVPSSFSDLDETQAFAFLNGGYKSSRGEVVAFDLRIFNDGVILDSRASTEENDRLIEEMLLAASQELGLVYQPKMVLKKAYISELFIRSKVVLDALNPRLQAFAEKLSKLIDKDFSVSQVSFWADPKAANVETQFLFERKRIGPFSDDYFSSAPVQTGDHIKLIEEFEKILAT